MFREPVRAIVGSTVYPGAPLTVYDLRQEGEPAIVLYADPELTVPHPTPLIADAAGRYPPIYTEAVKPLYALNEQPRDHAGRLMPGATLTFYSEDTTELAPIYSDEGLEVEATNPATADEDGEFAPIYLDEALRYRVLLKDQNGRLIYDMALRALGHGHFRVVAEGAFDVEIDLYDEQFSNLQLYSWLPSSQFPYPEESPAITGLNPSNYHRARFLLKAASTTPPDNTDQLGDWHEGASEDGGFVAAREEGNAASWPSGTPGEYDGFPLGWSLNGRTMAPAHPVSPGERVSLYVHFNKLTPSYLQGVVGSGGGGLLYCSHHGSFTPPLNTDNNAGRYDWWSPLDSGADNSVNYSGVWGQSDGVPSPKYGNHCVGSEIVTGGFFGHPDALLIVQRVPRPPLGYGWQPIIGTFHALAKYTEDGDPTTPSVTQYPLNPIVEVGAENDTEAFWTAAYAEAVAAEDMPAGLTYGTHYPVEVDTMYYRKYYG